MNKIILASDSPRRKMILNKFKIPFTPLGVSIDETNTKNLEPFEYVEEMSLLKALEARKIIQNSNIIISADTVVVFENKILGKPKNKSDAFEMLSMLRNNKHSVYTGLTVLNSENPNIVVDICDVFMRNYTDDEILNYIKSGEPFDKAGAYGIQELGGFLVDKINGDYYTVVGLPIVKLYSMLKNINISITDFWS